MPTRPKPWLLLAVLSLSTATAARAQFPTDSTAVLTELPGAQPTQVLLVDTSGNVAPMGPFPSSVLRPQAITIDPYDRELLIAVDLGTGGPSRVVRLRANGLALGGELALGDLPGPCRQLTVVSDEVLALVGGPGGGVFALPRRVLGTPRLVMAVAEPTAWHAFEPHLGLGVLASNPVPPSSNASAGYADLQNQTFTYGPHTFAPPTNAALTGVADLPTGAVRHAFSYADGTFAIWLNGPGSTPQVIPTVPPIPPGGAAAMLSQGFAFAVRAVGGQAFPFLYEVDLNTGVVTTLSGTLPGDPVDLALPIPSGPRHLRFGGSCSLNGEQVFGSGPPQLGDPNYELCAATPLINGEAVLFPIGFADTRSALTPLPLLLPGGCLLHVEPFSTTVAFTDSTGTACRPLPLPATPSLDGVLLFAQALPLAGTALTATPGLALQLGL